MAPPTPEWPSEIAVRPPRCRRAEKGDEFASLQLIELHPMTSRARTVTQQIELQTQSGDLLPPLARTADVCLGSSCEKLAVSIMSPVTPPIADIRADIDF